MIYVHLASGFEEIEALTVVDILRRAGLQAALVSVTGEKLVTGAHDITVMADITLKEADYKTCEMIVLPGGMPGAINLQNCEDLIRHIQCFTENNKYVAAICAAPLVLAHAGVLKNKKATIYPGMEEYLNEALYSEARIVVDDKIITSKGPGTAMEFALELVYLLAGGTMAAKLRKNLIML